MSTTAIIDLLSSKSFAGGHPFEQYRWLRENAPVYRHDEPDGPGFWAVTTHELVHEVSMHPEMYSNAVGGMRIFDYPPEDLEFFRTQIMFMDPPQTPSTAG